MPTSGTPHEGLRPSSDTDAPVKATSHSRSSPQLLVQQQNSQSVARIWLAQGSGSFSPSLLAAQGDLEIWEIGAGGSAFQLTDPAGKIVLTLTRGGRVGIGNSAPEARLHVAGPTLIEGQATVQILQITGGSDLAEPFTVREGCLPEPGTVMVIDPDRAGKLKISDTAYDSKVAGIVSGAGGLQPGLTLQQAPSSQSGVHVALAGRVYCKAEALSSPIQPGDLLTTSRLPGTAMMARDREAAQGATLGKAMTPLLTGKGLVLVLVNLQ